MPVINTDAELEAYGSTGGIALNDVSKLRSANTNALSEIQQAALSDYTAASFELLTATNSPGDLKQLHCWIAIAMYTDGDAQRTVSVDDRWTDAKTKLGILRNGGTHYDEMAGAVLVKRTVGASRGISHPNPRTRTFDRDTNDAYAIREEEL